MNVKQVMQMMRSVDTAAAKVAAEIRGGATVTVAVVEPGNAARYVIVLTNITPASPLVGNDWLVSLPEWRSCYPVQFTGGFVATYIAEKLTGGNVADGEVIAAFLNAVAERLR